MIRVMVVEDEPPIAQSIKRLAEEYGGGVTVVHTAINGRRALEYLEHSPVDLVFSDIKMPVMDGLELAKHLQRDFPQVILVIISGFQEFEFARTAIRYGVSNYLLKPVSREHVAEVLDKACDEVWGRRAKTTRDLLENAIHSEEDSAGAAGEPCGVLLLCGGAYPLIPDEGILESRDVWSAAEIEETLQGWLGPRETCVCTGGRSLHERVVVFPAASADRIAQIAADLYAYLTGQSQITATVAAWGEPAPIGRVGAVLVKLRKRIYKQIMLFRSQLLTGSDTEPGGELEATAQQTELILAMGTKNLDAIRRAVTALIETCVGQSARQTELVLCLDKTLISFFDGVLSMNQIGEVRFEVQSAITSSFHPDELAEDLSRALYGWVASGNQLERGELQTLCEEVAAYLRLHYRENIRGADLARQFGFSSTQLAKRFKEHFGVSVSEYVNQFRIQSAQAMMRGNRKMMVKEIALEVGYNDQYYFSKLFKKITGVWPTEYSSGIK